MRPSFSSSISSAPRFSNSAVKALTSKPLQISSFHVCAEMYQRRSVTSPGRLTRTTPVQPRRFCVSGRAVFDVSAGPSAEFSPARIMEIGVGRVAVRFRPKMIKARVAVLLEHQL